MDSKNIIVACIGIGALGLAPLYGYAISSARMESSIKSPEVYQRNILGDDKPETYVEVDGVKYFSHIDGKDISDLVKE